MLLSLACIQFAQAIGMDVCSMRDSNRSRPHSNWSGMNTRFQYGDWQFRTPDSRETTVPRGVKLARIPLVRHLGVPLSPRSHVTIQEAAGTPALGISAWLGRQDSNLGMAESKSDQFS